MKTWLLLLIGMGSVALADDFAAVVADRAAIERVYYDKRTGEKPPFAQALPRATLERLVRDDRRKEAALRKTYGVEVTPAMLQAEVQRIDTTTRAPEMLAEIKGALKNDMNRFAQNFAKPFIVERLLRESFDNDDRLHAPQRREMEKVRTRLTNAAHAFCSRRGNEALTEKSETRNPKSEIDQSLFTSTLRSNATEDGSVATKDLVEKLVSLLKQGHSNAVTETTWLFSARPHEKPGAEVADEIEIRKRFGPHARLVSAPPANGREWKFYFADLPGELQNVLRAQLRQPGDVSAVIEMPTGFLLYLAKERTAETLNVATLSLPKRSYEQWLAEQE